MADPTLVERIIHPDDRARYAEHKKEVLGATLPGETEFRVILPDGTQRWIGHVCQPVLDENGISIGKRGSNRDITERKHAEEALRRLNEKLEQRVRERTDELERKNNELKRLNQIFVGRELRMIELKKRISDLESQNLEFRKRA